MTSDDIHFVLWHINVGFSQIVYGLFLTIVYYEDLSFVLNSGHFLLFHCSEVCKSSTALFTTTVLECKCPPHASVTEHLVPSSQHCFGWSRSPGARFERSHTISCSFYPSWLAAMCCDQRPSAHVAFPDDIKHLPQLKARVTPPHSSNSFLSDILSHSKSNSCNIFVVASGRRECNCF